MRIALVSPLYEAVPPRLYGGTERIVAYLADALVDLGHQVTLFASAESKTKAALVACREQALRLDDSPLKSDVASHLGMLDEVRKREDQFDLIHFHLDLLPYPFFEHFAARTLTTLHGRLDIADLYPFYRRWHQYPLVSISYAQRQPMPDAYWVDNIYHGLPTESLWLPEHARADYLLFLGRISPEKRPDRAIQIARAVGMKLKIAAKLDPADECYYREEIEPLLDDPLVDYLGEVGDKEKVKLLGNAAAVLFPIDWPEPFGLVMIEAFGCGTPVIAWRMGSAPEIVDEGVTGFLVESEEEAVAAVARLGKLDRRRIREVFEQRFSLETMARHYVETYQKLLHQASGDNSGLGDTGRVQVEEGVAVDLEKSAMPTTVESDDTRMPYKLFALKHKDCFLVADSFGDVEGRGDGLFRNDTRILSRFHMELGERPLSLLSASVSQDNVFFTAHVTNRPLPPLGGRSIPEGVIHIERSRFLWEERLFERIKVVNYGEEPVTAPLRLQFGADYRDMFEVRGTHRKRRGELLPAEFRKNGVVLSYRGLDGEVRKTIISFSMVPQRLDERSAEFVIELAHKDCVEFYVEVGTKPAAVPSRLRYRLAAANARRAMRGKSRGGARIGSGERVFNNWVEKSRADLSLLITELPSGPYPYAGIPWFSTTFGRDGIITALQMLWFDPQVAKGVLAFLARTQAREVNKFQDSAPGKIMHEARKGEMSRLKEVAFGQYYGGVDSTPLFVMLAGAYADRTGDMEFIKRIWSSLEQAVRWIEEFGDADGDGLLDYARGADTGLANQGWKDSEDSVFHEDGRFPSGPIALVEVQGYRFAAYRAMERLAARRGDMEASERWRKKAEKVRLLVEARYWMEDKQFYGMAIDGEGQLCRVRGSNAGHLLYTGLADPERGRLVSQQLLSSKFDSGWGIRTLATDEKRYNPMSYHNGSVWPHDTAVCAAGLARYGDRRGAAHILSELFAASVHFGMRLPELFCGFQRFPGNDPIAYPVACIPQAWSSGAVFMILQGCLGISIDGWNNQVQIESPHLPAGVNQLRIRGLVVGNEQINITFQRIRERVVAFTEGQPQGNVQVVAHV